MEPFRYSDYESRLVDREYIRMLQKPRVRFFRGCRKVLDIACGSGIFLELLKEEGIEGIGVDRDEGVVQKAQSRGLKVIQEDIFHFLKNDKESYDGIFCSHFLEHLDFERVKELIKLISERLEREGVFVIVTPNPASIRLHLFGFWRDPEHVRFYTGNLLQAVCEHYQFRVVSSNEEEAPNRLETPRIDPLPIPRSRGFFSKSSEASEQLIHELNQRIEKFNQEMEKLSEVLNKIWSREDELVLVCRKV
jgi:O-antigen chain-terminating methyltransferase